MIAVLHQSCPLLVQIAGLEDVARALVVDIIDLRAERQRALESRTLWGALRNALGYALCAYCLFKYAGSFPVRHLQHA